jgi:hypothetical protein
LWPCLVFLLAFAMLDAYTTRLTTWADRIYLEGDMQAHGVSYWQIRVHHELIGRDVAISVICRRRIFCKASPGPIYLHGYLQGKPYHDSWCLTVNVEFC